LGKFRLTFDISNQLQSPQTKKKKKDLQLTPQTISPFSLNPLSLGFSINLDGKCVKCPIYPR
jgi:hypothetical protein